MKVSNLMFNICFRNSLYFICKRKVWWYHFVLFLQENNKYNSKPLILFEDTLTLKRRVDILREKKQPD